MNASAHAFRSHLMQQFMASARTQTRPPLALLGWVNEENENDSARNAPSSSSSTAPPSSTAAFRPVSSHPYNSTSSVGLPLLSSIPESSSSTALTNHTEQHQLSPPSRRWVSSASIPEQESEEQSDDVSLDTSNQHNLSALFQNLLQTRRSSTHFAPPPGVVPSSDEQQYWKDVLERAALCGYSAPNHKRTEPFTLKRMIAPSASTKRLAEIAGNVSLFQQQQSARPDDGIDSSIVERQRRERAEKKRDKWRKIPAFLVTLVESQHEIVPSSTADKNEYQPLDFMPPRTERELEDYASACAATQNMLLSLHSEQVASKWVTGPVIQTTAFRQLVQASPNDRVVSLLMVGSIDERKRVHRRRHRREFYGDVLVDL